MAAYAKCTIRTSFFVGDDEDFEAIKEQLMEGILEHPKVTQATFQAQVGYEIVAHYELEDDSDV